MALNLPVPICGEECLSGMTVQLILVTATIVPLFKLEILQERPLIKCGEVYLTKDCEMIIFMEDAVKRNRVVDVLLFRLLNIFFIVKEFCMCLIKI